MQHLKFNQLAGKIVNQKIIDIEHSLAHQMRMSSDNDMWLENIQKLW